MSAGAGAEAASETVSGDGSGTGGGGGGGARAGARGLGWERDLIREEVALSAGTWVVKVGSNVLTGADGRLDGDRIALLAGELAGLRASGRRVALVSSGAVAAGVGRLGLRGRPETLGELQAAASVGQAHLIRAWDEGFRRHGSHAAQLLLNHADFDSRERYLNIRNTIQALFEWGAIPVINENDSVSVDEIKFGDNDRLAAMVTNLLRAPLLVILSVVDGLYASDPHAEGASSNGEAAHPIGLVRGLDEATRAMAGTGRSSMGTGGMTSKLDAVSLVTRAGGSVIVTAGRREDPGPLTRVARGEAVGTLFLAAGRAQGARRRWIGLTARPRGVLTVDDGAAAALARGNKSLLGIGVVEVSGTFGKGDVVSIRDRAGSEVARGLSNYSAEEARLVSGKRTEEARRALGAAFYREVVHRDNLFVTGGEG